MSTQSEQKVFCIGLSRTGTSSLHDAFKLLGLKSIHAPFSLFENPLGPIIDEYSAFADLPIPHYYKLYAEHFPSAKFILTCRETESWLKSMKWLLDFGSAHYNFPGSGWEKGGTVERMHQEIYGTHRFRRAKLKDFYELHTQEVRQFFSDKPDRFLELNIKRDFNFETLCPFLHLPIPNAKFPHANTSVKYNRFRIFIRRLRTRLFS